MGAERSDGVFALFPGQFELFDADADDVVTETESKQILDSIVATQKAVLTELFATHVRVLNTIMLLYALPTLTLCTWDCRWPTCQRST